MSGFVFSLFLTSAVAQRWLVPLSDLDWSQCTDENPPKGTILAPVNSEQRASDARGWQCKQPELCRPGGSHSRDPTDPALAVPHVEPRNTLTASATGTAEHGQDTHSQGWSVQVWTPSHYPLKWHDASQLLTKWTQTMSLISGLMGFSNSSGSYPETSTCKKST